MSINICAGWTVLQAENVLRVMNLHVTGKDVNYASASVVTTIHFYIYKVSPCKGSIAENGCIIVQMMRATNEKAASDVTKYYTTSKSFGLICTI
jgi:hypothetical protein